MLFLKIIFKKNKLKHEQSHRIKRWKKNSFKKKFFLVKQYIYSLNQHFIREDMRIIFNNHLGCNFELLLYNHQTFKSSTILYWRISNYKELTCKNFRFEFDSHAHFMVHFVLSTHEIKWGKKKKEEELLEKYFT